MKKFLNDTDFYLFLLTIICSLFGLNYLFESMAFDKRISNLENIVLEENCIYENNEIYCLVKE